MQKVRVVGQRSMSQRSLPNVAVSGLWLQFEFTDGYEMMHKAWCNIEEVLFSFPKSTVKFQVHMGQKYTDFDLNWTFPGYNSSFNSPMALKWCKKLNV